MNDGIDMLRIKQRRQRRTVLHIDFIEFRAFPRDLLNPVNHHLLGIAEVIRNNDIVPFIQKFNTGMGTDKTGTARYKNLHNVISLSYDFTGALTDPGDIKCGAQAGPLVIMPSDRLGKIRYGILLYNIHGAAAETAAGHAGTNCTTYT